MITEIETQSIKDLIKEGKRVDGRKFDEYRDMKIETGYIDNAEGSAMVTLGKTQVLVGVKMSIGEPFPDTPNDGVLMVNAELGPIASPDFESGPPDDQSVELARVVDRGVRESKAINTEKLCIEQGEKVWMVSVDIHIINDNGNLMDAAGIGAIAALLDTKVPSIDKEGKMDRENPSGKLEVSQVPVPCSIYMIDGKMVLDPDLKESEASDGFITITSVDGSLCAMQKSGVFGVSPDELYKAIDISVKRGDEVRKKYFK